MYITCIVNYNYTISIYLSCSKKRKLNKDTNWISHVFTRFLFQRLGPLGACIGWFYYDPTIDRSTN